MKLENDLLVEKRYVSGQPDPSEINFSITDVTGNSLHKVISVLVMVLPYVVINHPIYIILRYGYNGWFDNQYGILFSMSLAVLLFSTIEILTGISGYIPLSRKTMINHRDGFRGLILANFILSQAMASHFTAFSYDILLVPYNNFQILILYVGLEFIIFLRDHIPSMHPLANSRPVIRFFTPHYIMIEIPFLFSLYYLDIQRVNISYLSFIAITLIPTIGLCLAYQKRFPVSLRFWVVGISLQLASVAFAYGSLVLIFILPIMFLIRHFPKKEKIDLSWAEPVKNRYKDYYRIKK